MYAGTDGFVGAKFTVAGKVGPVGFSGTVGGQSKWDGTESHGYVEGTLGAGVWEGAVEGATDPETGDWSWSNSGGFTLDFTPGKGGSGSVSSDTETTTIGIYGLLYGLLGVEIDYTRPESDNNGQTQDHEQEDVDEDRS